MLVNRNIKIEGRVQGVGFRYAAFHKAKELDIKGFVRNNSDGTVYIEVEGEEENVNKFIEWCYQGPPLAKVTNVYINNGILKYFQSFEIR